MILRSKIYYLLLLFIFTNLIRFHQVFGEDVPIPRFQITSNDEYITIHDSVTISLEHSYIPDDNKAYTFCVIFDENSITEDDLENIWKGKKKDLLESEVRFSHYYGEPGDKTVVILVTSTKFYLSDDNTITSDGLIASSTKKIQLKVESGIYGYYYSHYVDWDPYSNDEFNKRYFNGNSPVMHIQIKNSHYPSNLQIAKEATKSFSLIGEHPTLYLYNNTHSFTIESENILNDDFEWQIRIDKKILYSANPISLKIESKGTNILGRGIKNEEIVFHIPTVNELVLGLDITDKFKYDNSTTKGNIRVDNDIYKITRIDAFHSPSTPNLNILNLQLSNESSNGAGLHSVLALTTDFMETYKIYNLRKTNVTAESDIFTTCQGTSKLSCNVQEFINIMALQRYLIIQTNTGVYYTSLPSALTNFLRPTGSQPSPLHFLKEMHSTVAKQGYENIKLMSTVNIITTNSTYVYGIFSTSSTGTKNRLIYSLENYFVKGMWRALKIDDIFSTLNIQNKDKKTEFISAIRYDNQNIYLIGVPVEDERYPNLYRNCAVVIHTTTIFDKTTDFSMEYNLPPDEYFYGMSLHENNNDIFLYGTSIYHSIDGGYTFKLKTKLFIPEVGDTLRQPEYFTELKSTHYRSVVYFITNLYNVYCGNTSVTRYLPLNWAHLTPNQLIKYFINSHGKLSVLDYSLGSLDSNINNNINSYYPLNRIFSSGTIPTKAIMEFSNFNSIAFESPFPMVPILRNDHDIWLYGYNVDSPFDDIYLGYVITAKNTDDRLLIYDVNKRKNMLRVIPENGFTHEVRNDPLEISLHNRKQKFSSSEYIDFDSFTIPLKKDAKATIKTKDMKSRIWTKGDVNKVIVVSGGSFIIRRIVDNRTVLAELVFPLPRWMDIKGDIPPKTIYLSWEIYDLRGTIVYDTPLSYKVYLTEASSHELKENDVVTISLNNDNNFFTYEKMNDIIVIGDIDIDKYIIGEIVNTNGSRADIKVNRLGGTIYQKDNQDFTVLKSRKTFENNKSLLDLNTMDRVWSLKMDNCHWNNLEMTELPDINYIDYNGELNITVKVNTDNSNIKAAEHYQANSQFFMTLSNPNILQYDNSNSYGNSKVVLNLNLKDIGKRGMNILNIFPLQNSIYCDTELPIKYFFNQCPPSRVVVPDLGDQNDNEYENNLMELPFNYRPPSYLGNDVPVSDAFYHAHPGKDRIKNRFKVSKQSGKYKQCEGKSDRQECQCTEEQKSSMLMENSDCIEKVLKLYQTNNYQLKFFIKEYGKETVVLDKPFNITELNNRTDYCISDCSNDNKNVYDPLNDKIVWKGEELYHFKIEVDYYYCVLSTEMIYYVIKPNPGFSIETSIMCLVCFVFILWILGTYIFYYINKVKGR